MRTVRAEEVCTLPTAIAGLSIVGTSIHGSCASPLYYWKGEVFADPLVATERLLRDQGYANESASERAALAQRVVTEVSAYAPPPWGIAATSEQPPCTACQWPATYRPPETHREPNGDLRVAFWVHWGTLNQLQVVVHPDGSLEPVQVLARVECSLAVPVAATERERRCAAICTRASACDPTPPPAATPPPGKQGPHGEYDPSLAAQDQRVAECVALCAAEEWTDEGFQCWAEAPEEFFFGRSGELTAGVCRSQEERDSIATSDPATLSSILEPVVAGMGRCDDAKRVSRETIAEWSSTGVDSDASLQLHRTLWDNAASMRGSSLLQPSVRNVVEQNGAAQEGYRAVVLLALKALGSPELASRCKRSLMELLRQTEARCQSADATNSGWFEEAAAAACGPG